MAEAPDQSSLATAAPAPAPAPAAASNQPPTGYVSLSMLAAADPLGPVDYLWGSQFSSATGRYRSVKVTFAQVSQAARPTCVHLTAAHTATSTEVGFTLDPTGGDFTLTMAPLAQLTGREVALIQCGRSGVVTVQGQPGEPVIAPTGAASSLTFHPGETARLRAVVVPSPAVSGWYLVCV